MKSASRTVLHAAHGRVMALMLSLATMIAPQEARAHFSYSDPRIIHVTENADGNVEIFMRMPVPLALLPEDWKGNAETRLPPFAVSTGNSAALDVSALDLTNPELAAVLERSLTVQMDGETLQPVLRAFRVWHDSDRPRFGTAKTAIAALENNSEPKPVPYFDATLDIRLALPGINLNRDMRLTSSLGENFQVIEKFGTVVKFHRSEGTETKAIIGVLDVSFPPVTTRLQTLRNAALSGAEHIYLGLDHLGLILLIALAATGWRQALGWASAFTLGHIITLAAGLYGVAPAASWFIPVIEIGIALSIVLAGVAIFLKANSAIGWVSLFFVGLIHGYGFAASAATALFAGDFDPPVLLAFAAGLELCQFAIYALVLPAILIFDRYMPMTPVSWRRAVALGIALCAVFATLSRLSVVSGAFAVA
ncbi:Hydrogenase/urease accessory protein HupE [Poseidonocella pacifica]|uniref:Hydrogenase/urease accessory protein HupE n=1 Tax=Poseidonocella pacifica TaxID=871651 RepID=A0A1I0W9J9_9RHOB|nr:HupE/UreJ family protein [Poseidonocella pacifica]SFA84693.1 Hydrogenase/urease accessory protein HupE [Poseidonocella pacifica]